MSKAEKYLKSKQIKSIDTLLIMDDGEVVNYSLPLLLNDYHEAQLKKIMPNEYNEVISQMEQSIIKSLSQLEKGYGQRKLRTSKNTGIPIDILTILLKRLKYRGEIELIMLWDERTGIPDGSGYCLSGHLSF